MNAGLIRDLLYGLAAEGAQFPTEIFDILDKRLRYRGSARAQRETTSGVRGGRQNSLGITTEVNRRHRIALLEWEAACERLKAAIEPHATLPPPTDEKVAEAIANASRALDLLREAFRPKS
jgi:hypothetical protein